MRPSILALRAAAFATTALAGLSAVTATAQDPQMTETERADQGGSTDIVVTANREESLASKTPIALTAITGDDLRDAGITQPIDLVEQVPSLEANRSRGGLNFTVRGVATNDTSEKGDSSTAFLLDGIYIARAPMRDASFFDVSRVEVLRGPQGTLYGRNTTAGVISVITNRPEFNFKGSIDGTVANFDTYQLTGVVNVPVTSNVAVRGAVDYQHNGSFLRGGPAVDPSYKKAREILAGRLSALLEWDSGEVILRGDYADIGGANFYGLPLRNFFAPAAALTTPQYIASSRTTDELLALNVTIPFPMYRNNNSWGVSVDFSQDLGLVSLYYLGAYRELNRDEQFANIFSNGINGARQQTIEKDWQQSHELRLALNDVDRLRAQVGAFYFKEESDVIQRLNVGINTTPTGVAGTNLFFDIKPSAAESYAFFGQATYSLTDALRVTGGIRYTHDEKSRRGYGNVVCANNFFTCGVAPGAPETERSDFASSKVTWKLGADFDVTPGTMLYATVATGYKAGGFNNGCAIGSGPGCTVAPSVLYFDPESLTSYEAGVKARFGGAVQINAAVFHYDYSDLQLTQGLTPCPSTPNNPNSTCSFTRNAAAAKIDGVELEATLDPSDRDHFDLSMAYLNARYADFPIRTTVNLAGEPLNRAPEWSASAGYQRTFEFNSGYEIVAGVRTRLSDSYVVLYQEGVNFFRQPSYTQTDATVTLNAPDRRWYVQGFAKNLENAIVFNDVGSGTFAGISVNDPRTYGVRAGFKF